MPVIKSSGVLCACVMKWEKIENSMFPWRLNDGRITDKKLHARMKRCAPPNNRKTNDDDDDREKLLLQRIPDRSRRRRLLDTVVGREKIKIIRHRASSSAVWGGGGGRADGRGLIPATLKCQRKDALKINVTAVTPLAPLSPIPLLNRETIRAIRQQPLSRPPTGRKFATKRIPLQSTTKIIRV